MKSIAVIGSLNVDYVVYVKQAPVMGETLLSERIEIMPGGKGANQAFAIGRMGAPVAMFGAVGNDANALIELNNLQRANVDISHVFKIEKPTGVAMITVDSSGDNCIIVSPGANLMMSSEYIDSQIDALRQYDIIIFQLEIPLKTVVYAAKTLKSMGKIIILDPAPAPGRLPDDLLQYIDYIKPNENELAKLTEFTDMEKHLDDACNKLLNQGVKCVLASLGSAGVMVKQSGKKGCLYKAEEVKAVDTTAAGDSFTAAFAYAIANGRSVEEAVRFANKVAAVVVQREGAQQSIPSSEEIKRIWKAVFSN